MKKIDKTGIIMDTLWLIIMMISIGLNNHSNDIQGLVYTISLMIWYVGARFLIASWKY